MDKQNKSHFQDFTLTASKPLVFIIDPKVFSRTLIEKTLTDEGFPHRSYKDWEEAMPFIEDMNPSLLLVDDQVPPQTTQGLLSLQEKIIFLGQPMNSSYRFISKPLTIESLKQTLLP